MYKHPNLLQHTLEKRLFLLAVRYTHVHDSLSHFLFLALLLSRSLVRTLSCALVCSAISYLQNTSTHALISHYHNISPISRTEYGIVSTNTSLLTHFSVCRRLYTHIKPQRYTHNTCTNTKKHTHIFTHTSIHARAIARTHKHTRHAHTHTLVYSSPSIEYTHVHAYARTGTYTHTCTLARVRALTNAHLRFHYILKLKQRIRA